MNASTKPNILFIFGDQHSKFHLGCYGHEFVKTPNLDRLASKGLRFNHCISNSPVCVPARGTLLTGLYAGKHKAIVNDIAIDYSCESIADVLKSEGYHTGYMGKWHLAGIPREQAITSEKRLGFETWKVANCNHNYLDCYYYDEDDVKHTVDGYEPELFGGLALDFLDEQKKAKKPWALYVSFATPHEPFGPIAPEYLAEYDDVEITLRPNVPDKVIFRDHIYTEKEEYRQGAKGYFGHITAIDKQIGFMIDKLKETNQLDNTIVIYSADHGEMLGGQGLRDKQVPYEESIGIPLIAYWKDHIYQGTCDELISMVDLPITLASLVGGQFKTEVDGKDLSSLFVSPASESYESSYIYDFYPVHQGIRRGIKAWRGIRTKRYTYAVQADNLDWLLFDNEVDPYQMNNLAEKSEYADLQATLWAMLKAHITKNDILLDGESYMIHAGQVEAFNASQSYFNLPIIDAGKKLGQK